MLPYSTKNTTAHYAVSVCWNWMQSIKSNEKCLGNERERINLWHSQFNKLFELRMYAVNVLCGTTKSNQIRVLNARTYIHLVCIRCISVHLNVRTITSTHSNFRSGRMVWVRSVHLKSLWYENMLEFVHRALRMKRIQIAMMNRTQQYFNWLSAFVRQTCIKAYAHANTHKHTVLTHSEWPNSDVCT